MNSTKQQALIVVDVQNGFLSPYTRRALPHIHNLLELDWGLVIATRFYNAEGSPFRKQIHWNRLSSEEEITLDPKVEKRADVIIDKPTYGVGSKLLELLAKHNLTSATVVGIDTDVCVLQNAAQLFDAGITTTVDHRACATNGGPQAEQAAIALLRRTVGGDYVITGNEALIA